MNHSTLLQPNPFPLEYPVTTDSDYSSHRSFTGSSGFSMDEDDHNRRINTLGHPLAQPVSIPVSNGLRYNAQATASMQDVSFATSPSMLMSPGDTCSEAFSSTSYSPTPNSIYSPSPALSYDRMSSLGTHRMPLQPPTAQINPSTPGNWRTDNFPGSYGLQRGQLPSLPGFTSSPRGYDNAFMAQPNLYLESMHRYRDVESPPWNNETNILHHVWVGNLKSGQTIKPEIRANIPSKKFFLDGEKWTCYRRNYLSVTCSFSLHPCSSGPFWVKTENNGVQQIRSFAMSLSATVDSKPDEPRELVQHSPKRDKQSERPPAILPVQPCPPPLSYGHGPAGTNGSQHGYGMASQSAGLYDYGASSYVSGSHSGNPPTQCTFERIQFAKATANNGKRRATQQFYNLVVDLYAEVERPIGGKPGDEWIKIARRLSHPMVVRGRSPGHYREHRRDSQSSMDPDGGAGGTGEHGGMLPPGFPKHFSMMGYEPASSGRYGRTDYHQHIKPEQSPLSDHSPHASSSSSTCTLDMGILNDTMDPMDIKATSSMDSYDNSFVMVDMPQDRKPAMDIHGTEGGENETTLPFRNPLPSFDYDTLSKEEDVGVTSPGSFPDNVASMVAMMPSETSESSFIRNPPRVPSQPAVCSSGGGGFNAFVDNSFGRFDSVQGSQELCT